VSAAQAQRAVEAAKRLVEHAEQKLNAALPLSDRMTDRIPPAPADG
jgi:hypothetical protein